METDQTIHVQNSKTKVIRKLIFQPHHHSFIQWPSPDESEEIEHRKMAEHMMGYYVAVGQERYYPE